MTKYIDILLTANGRFCVAPSWEVKVGDFVNLRNVLTGDNEIVEVISVATDKPNGEFVGLVKAYLGYDLPRITECFRKKEVALDENVPE